MYTKLQIQWHIQCCHRWLNSLSHTLLHSHYSNTVNISTVVMLGFWLCQINTGSLAFRLFLSSSTKFYVCLFEFNICSLGYVGEVWIWSFIRCCLSQFSYWYITLEVPWYVSAHFFCTLFCQHGVWCALNIWALIVLSFIEEYMLEQKMGCLNN